MKIILKSRKNEHYAEADYIEGKVKILKGSRINKRLVYEKMASEAKKAREDSTIVDDNGIVIEDIMFNSPSTAAQFVTGRSTNGYISWRPDDKVTLKAFLKINKQGCE